MKLFYKIKYIFIKKMIDKDLRINNTKETLIKIIQEKKSIARFGDGEFNLLKGNDIPFQNHSKEINNDLSRVLYDQDNNKECLVCVPYAFCNLEQFTQESKNFWIKYISKNYLKIRRCLNLDYNYYDSQCSRIYINRNNKNESKMYFEMWKSIFKNKKILIIEGEKTRFGVGNDLFEETAWVKRVLCPEKNAYSCLDEIKKVINTVNDVDLILLALGPSATILAYDLSKQNKWVIDSGNLDIEYEWYNIKTVEKVIINNKYSMEIEGGEKTIEERSSTYISQIIYKVGENE